MANVIKQRGDMFSHDRSEMTPARRKMIHDHRKKADRYGPELPIQFGIFKPKLGNKPREIEFECGQCGTITYVSKITHGIVCKGCNQFQKVK